MVKSHSKDMSGFRNFVKIQGQGECVTEKNYFTEK